MFSVLLNRIVSFMSRIGGWICLVDVLAIDYVFIFSLFFLPTGPSSNCVYLS